MKSNKEYLEEIYEKKIEAMNSKEKDEFYNIRFKKPKKSPLKIAATFLIALSLMVGVGYCGAVTYQNIWKEPKKYTINDEVSDEEKEKCISAEEAKELGDKYLKQVGLEDDEILNQNLNKEFLSDENEWSMSSQKATIRIDAKTGELKSIQVPTWNYKIPYNYGITREEAREVANELFKKYLPDIEGEYELTKLTRNMETDEASYIWYAEFYRKYGEEINPYERVVIGWIPTINGIYQLNVEKGTFENNEIVKTEEEAIEIAKNKDKEIETNREIESVTVEESIQKMNPDAYLRETRKDEYEAGKILLEDGYYVAENRVRRVWLVTINYVEEENKLNSFTYFVDGTTGEIIGGATYNPEKYIENLRNDPNNFAKAEK